MTMEMRRTQRTNTRAFISRHSENMAPRNDVINGGGGLLFCPPPSLSYSYPPLTSLFNNGSSHNYQRLINRQQLPLLPLPISSRPNNNFVSSRSRGFSCRPNTRKANRSTRDQSLKPKKSKQQPPNIREEEPKQDSKSGDERVVEQKISTESSLMVSDSPSGPDPNDLPKLDKFTGSVFTFSPPPSSLPLPKFSLRPKLCCNAEASGIDAGATDSLRRMLRLL